MITTLMTWITPTILTPGHVSQLDDVTYLGGDYTPTGMIANIGWALIRITIL